MAPTLPTPSNAEKARAVVTGKVIEALRLKRGWSQTELAIRVGIGQATISRLESGNLLRPDAFLFRRLADEFGITAETLHAHIDASTEKIKKMTDRKGDDWWAPLAIAALGGLALFVVLSLLEDEAPPKGAKSHRG